MDAYMPRFARKLGFGHQREFFQRPLSEEGINTGDAGYAQPCNTDEYYGHDVCEMHVTASPLNVVNLRKNFKLAPYGLLGYAVAASRYLRGSQVRQSRWWVHAHRKAGLCARIRLPCPQTACEDKANPQPHEQRRDGVAADEPREVS
jgi:hypothetical protein